MRTPAVGFADLRRLKNLAVLLLDLGDLLLELLYLSVEGIDRVRRFRQGQELGVRVAGHVDEHGGRDRGELLPDLLPRRFGLEHHDDIRLESGKLLQVAVSARVSHPCRRVVCGLLLGRQIGQDGLVDAVDRDGLTAEIEVLRGQVEHRHPLRIGRHFNGAVVGLDGARLFGAGNIAGRRLTRGRGGTGRGLLSGATAGGERKRGAQEGGRYGHAAT